MGSLAIGRSGPAAAGPTSSGPERPARHAGGIEQRLNALRAGVLGANDGIVSVAAVVVGVAGATTQTGPIATAGLAAALGGAVSMALGEYVSVSSQRDSERHLIAVRKQALREDPEGQVRELAAMYEARGLSPATARQVADEETRAGALAAHVRARHHIDLDDVASPWHAAFASFGSFVLGALLPLVAILLPPAHVRAPVTFVATLVALALTGAIAAGIGGGSRRHAALRVVLGGALALAVTYAAGVLLGVSGVV